ncbi:MAG: hypothetical protein ACLFSC_11135 [Wenzhouxiangella sp.]
MNKVPRESLIGLVLKGTLVAFSILVYLVSWGFTPLVLLAPPVLLVLGLILFMRGAKKTAIVIGYWALATFFMGPMLSFDRLVIWVLVFGFVLMAVLFIKSMTDARKPGMGNPPPV